MLKRATSVADILNVLGDALLRVSGPVDRVVNGPVALTEATLEAQVAFCTARGSAGVDLMRSSRAGVVVCPDDQAFAALEADRKTLIIVSNPRLAFARLVGALFTPEHVAGIHPSAVVHPEALVHSDAYVGPFTHIGRSEVGAGTVIYSSVHIYSGVRIGRNATIHAGVVLGSDGFGFERDEHGKPVKFPHLGGIVIGDDVELGAGTCVDRGGLGDTVIGEATKLDNMVHVAHNVRIGQRCLIAACAMIAGTTTIGDDVWIGPGASLSDHLVVSEAAQISIGAVVTRNVAAGARVTGNFAVGHRTFMRNLAQLSR